MLAYVNKSRGWIGCADCLEEADFKALPKDPKTVLRERGTHFCDNCGVDLLLRSKE